MVLDNFVELGLNKSIVIDDELTLSNYESGHIIGSVALHLELKRSNGEVMKLTFTGDIGRKDDAILKGPLPFPQSDYIICESTYGNRLHAVQQDVEERLLQVVNDTCVLKGGKIVIPAFSIDRTQEIIYALDQLSFAGKLPKLD